MTYTVYAFTNDEARLCAGTTRTDMAAIAALAEAEYKDRGYVTKTEIDE